MQTGSSTNFFGTFLDTFSREPASPKAAGTTQPIDAILKSLNAGPLSLAELMPAANHSAAVLLEALGKLEGSGMVERTNDERIALTQQGHQVAALTR
jgi:predicted Rossmann fold nucleotide-binding protein DprA/Smf involved in DNA uptake